MTRFILDRAMCSIRHDVATFVVMFITAWCWPLDLVFDLIGIAP